MIKKIYNQFLYRSLLYPKVKSDKFPEKNSLKFQVMSKIHLYKTILNQRKICNNLGSLYTSPHSIAVKTWKKLIRLNPNNLGNWSTTNKVRWDASDLEREVIHKTIDLLGGTTSQLEGYVTSGGTESNIFSAWLGREMLLKKNPSSTVCLIKTKLSHYSIAKTAQVINVPFHNTPLNKTYWNMDAEKLVKTITNLHKRYSYTGFLIPLTLGYTPTGTSDDIQQIVHSLRTIKKSYKQVSFYCWIDAALNGLTEPFIKDKFRPFSNPEIYSYLTDFHKFGLVPYPAGVVIYKKKLRSLIETKVDYASIADSTLLGSRSGIPAAATWAMIHYFGQKGYKDTLKKCLAMKEIFINKYKEVFPENKVITEPNSITCAVVVDKNKKIPKEILVKYWLHTQKPDKYFKKMSNYLLYTFFFLPHVTNKTITNFFKDISTLS